MQRGDARRAVQQGAGIGQAEVQILRARFPFPGAAAGPAEDHPGQQRVRVFAAQKAQYFLFPFMPLHAGILAARSGYKLARHHEERAIAANGVRPIQFFQHGGGFGVLLREGARVQRKHGFTQGAGTGEHVRFVQLRRVRQNVLQLTGA